MNSYIRSFFTNLKTFQNTDGLENYPTKQNGEMAIVISSDSISDPKLGFFKFYLNSNLTLISNFILPGLYGQWIKQNNFGIMLNDSNIIDPSCLQIFPATNVITSQGIANYTGGSSTVTITTPGSKSNDIAIITPKSVTNTSNLMVGCYEPIVSNNSIEFSMGGDPGNSNFNYMTFTPAS